MEKDETQLHCRSENWHLIARFLVLAAVLIFQYSGIDAIYVAEYLPTFRGSFLPLFSESK